MKALLLAVTGNILGFLLGYIHYPYVIFYMFYMSSRFSSFFTIFRVHCTVEWLCWWKTSETLEL